MRAKFMAATFMVAGIVQAIAAPPSSKEIGRILIESLPKSGPHSWCGKPEMIGHILDVLNGSDSLQSAGQQAVDFLQSTTTQLDAVSNGYSCHGILELNDFTKIPGTFSVRQNSAGREVDGWIPDQYSGAAP
jgi:hypothetical protein